MCMLNDSINLVGKLLAIYIFTTCRAYLYHSLPCKIMEQCRLCPAKLWSNADFAPQIHGAFILCPAKLWSYADFALRNYGPMQTLPRKITET